MFTHPVSYFESATRRHGPVARLSLPGFGRVVSVTDPALIKQIFLDHDRAHAGEASKVMGPVLGPHSVLLLDGGEHMRQRKLLLPPFHGEALRAYEERIVEITRREIAGWPADRPFSMRPRMQAITLQVILEVIFGIEDAERRDRYSHAIDRLMAVSNLLGLDTRPDRGRPSRIAKLIAKRRAPVDELIFEDVEHRRQQPSGGDDVLSLLLAARDEDGNSLTDSELRDELVTMLFAGHETTATALAWAIDLLVWNPAAYERATEAARDGDDEYLDAVAKETLRIRPVVWSTGRIVQQPFQLGRWTIAPGVRLWSPMNVLAADERIYERPGEFEPERFVDAQPPAYAWIPFGGGIRRCIGAAFASLEMRLVLKEMLLAGEFTSAAKSPERQRMRAVTLAPANGTRVRFTPFVSSRVELEGAVR